MSNVVVIILYMASYIPNNNGTIPIVSVDWLEWGVCDPTSCTRARTQACMCLMETVSPDICMVDLQTETQPCDTGILFY